MDYKDELLCCLLNCCVLDFIVISETNYDYCDIIDVLKEDGIEINLNNLSAVIMNKGLCELQEEIERKIDEFEMRVEEESELQDMLDDLRKLNPYDDTEQWHNYIDTFIRFSKNADIYKLYLSDEFEEFYINTGYEIGS